VLNELERKPLQFLVVPTSVAVVLGLQTDCGGLATMNNASNGELWSKSWLKSRKRLKNWRKSGFSSFRLNSSKNLRS
jgi:hypothetical protein